MNSADDFRRSIEASLPPLTQYSVQACAPGLYGAFGWGSMLAGSRQEADSIRASRASADASNGLRTSQDPDAELSPSFRNSASLRNSFAQQTVSDTQEVRDSNPPEVSLGANGNAAASPYSGTGVEQARAQALERPALSSPYGNNYPQEQAHQAAYYVSKAPTAPNAPSPGPATEGAVVVHAAHSQAGITHTVNSPSRLYPAVPNQQKQTPPRTAMRDDASGPYGGRQFAGQGAPEPVEPSFAMGFDGNPVRQGPPSHPGPPPPPQFFQKSPPKYPPPPNGSSNVQGRVVHMRRMEAWTKYIAYEGCLQVCTSELEGGHSAHARHFLSGAFALLRKGLGVDGLLLTQLASAPALGSLESALNDICWDDMEPPEKRLNTFAFANSTSLSYMRIRCQRLTLPSATVLQKLCYRTRTFMSLPSFSGVTVHLAPSDDSCDTVTFTLDSNGSAIQQSQAIVFPMDSAQPTPAQPAVQPPQRLDILIDGPNGPIATGSLPYRELWRIAMQQKDPVDEALAIASFGGTSVEVQVRGAGEFLGKMAILSVNIQRVRKDIPRFDVAQVTGDNTGVDTVNKNTLRTNACLAYDVTLLAALEATGCGRNKLLVDGAWEWLLNTFASYFGVRAFYCTLAHLRWVLKPGVATISTTCLDVIASELRPLLEQSALRGLTTHEATILEGVKKAVEMLLEVAFENYYALGDDQARDGFGNEVPNQPGAVAWRPTVLMASFRLFRVMRDVFLPTDQDWLNTRFRIAAKKRWHFLECNCGYEQLRDLPRGQQPQLRPPNVPKLGHNVNAHDAYYKLAEKMGLAIRSDLEFDMFLQNLPDLLPSTLNLPRITADEYMANFVEILRNMLSKCPPMVPSVPAVDLLVATATLQRYLQDTKLSMPHQHPGHLDAMDLWRPHVLAWIDSSRRGLCGHCGKLEAEAKLNAATLARVDITKMPGMIEGIEGAVAPLVHDMLDRTWSELMLYERVIRNWPLFGPHLEAALCDVLRTVQGALNRICAGASNTALQPGGSPHMNVALRRGQHPTASPNVQSKGMGGPGMPRTYGGGSPGLSAAGGRSSPGVPMIPHQGPMMPSGFSGGRIAVLLKEAVLLNSLKVLMVMVPSIEDIISKWCGGSSVAPPGLPEPGPNDTDFGGDDLAPHIGAQFAQVVKELRTDYAEGVASCANRMANHIRASPSTNIKVALNQPKPPSEPHHAYQPVSTLTQQREFVEAFMRPILSACEEGLQALRAALDPRVFVATGRALWDCMGKDLFEFVHFLQESHDNKGAWRLRQHAHIALTHLCEYFRMRLAASMEHCIGERDLDLPINVDKAQKLLAQNTAVMNITLNPI